MAAASRCGRGLQPPFLLLLSCLGALWAEGAEGRPVAVVLPVVSTSRLRVDQEGLKILQNIEGPVAPVVVIGPYRSGKSFLLNQLLNVSCDSGFGVGHTRNTQTKGIWVWSSPVKVPTRDAIPLSVVYMDTEGFESAGKSDSYDDRIFALSAIMSSVLIYNLPETVRESDVEKLSFAIELASGLYNTQGSASNHLLVEPGSMIWLIQRDFLTGKTVQQMVDESLAQVDNPYHDKDIDQINRIRKSLSLVARNSTAFGLTQPHLNRTGLCSMGDAMLDEGYVRQKAQLLQLVRDLATPKIMQGSIMTGKRLAELIERVVEALNERDIPSVTSIVDSFNAELVHKCIQMYVANWADFDLPKDEDILGDIHATFLQSAMEYYDSHRFGSSDELREGGNVLRDGLAKQLEREYDTKRTANSLKSLEICESLERECEQTLERLQAMNLPSKKKFVGEFSRCEELTFDAGCKGPALAKQKARLQAAWKRELGRFEKDYNDRLYLGMVIVSLAGIVAFRFIFKVQAMEGVCWVLFVFLEGYPRLIESQAEMYSSGWWTAAVRVWEFLVYNLVTKSGCLMLACFGLFFLWRLGLRIRRRKGAPKRDSGRDLDV
ncbi:unnamed protein product [Ostreobium quekettii]|uniref:GB1/RHD3-type G domain-containing protein n=1 Tax=Ostreobium quekettii TaxID=121088 RepID=A0A8S1J5L0_9CHLO|nr:unnamed protein product [Ostreobium quekettii]|eukprot:evm.model.scf_1293EXC.4 EVM.evm.TU.scf_1293EXC.4   scf_1293EXC:19944-22759(+)